MKVAVVNLTAGGLSGGYRKYLLRLVPLLRTHPDVSAVEVFLPRSAAAALEGSSVEPFLTWEPGETGVTGRGLRARVRAWGPDAVLIPTARWDDFGVPTVTMVRNMEPLTAPLTGNSLSEGARNVARRMAARRACRRSDAIIAVSEFVQEFVVGAWQVPRSRVGVIPHGVDDAEPGSKPVALGAAPGPFLFTAGSIRPARGLEDIIRALPNVQVQGAPATLVVGGEATAGSLDHAGSLRALAASLGVAERITWTGALTPPEMAWCFDHCEAFVMTSRMEACPNLVLEALSHGTPSVSTDARPMPEFFRDTAWYYRGGDAASLSTALASAVQADVATREQRRAAMRERAADFTWQRTADATVALLASTVQAQGGATRRSA